MHKLDYSTKEAMSEADSRAELAKLATGENENRDNLVVVPFLPSAWHQVEWLGQRVTARI